jgi:putative hydrolase of the HAD superfamily
VSSSGSIEIVFFDAGETLVHPHPSFGELFAMVAHDHGYDVSADTVRAVQDRLAPHLIDIAEETGAEFPSLSREASETFWSYLYKRFLEELGIADESLVAKLYATFSSSSSYKLFDDVIPTLEELKRRRYRLGLISNFEGWLEELLMELEVGHIFDTTVISGIEGVEKPDPLIYRIALERAGVEPGAAMHVGDSPVLDVEPAKEVGMKAVLLDRVGRYPRADDPKIVSLKELPPLVSNL